MKYKTLRRKASANSCDYFAFDANGKAYGFYAHPRIKKDLKIWGGAACQYLGVLDRDDEPHHWTESLKRLRGNYDI